MAKKQETKKEEIRNDVVLIPQITEKAALAQKNNVYVFEVPVTYTKSEIAKAFEKTYKQKPVKVNLVQKQRKSIFRKGTLGFTAQKKKAYIFVKKGIVIEVK